jgi:hypothetical protein
VGTQHLVAQLQSIVKPTLHGLTPTAQVETSLRTLMDYLSKIKETCSAIQFTTGIQYPKASQDVDTVLKLVAIVKANGVGPYPSGDFIEEPETRHFWELKIGKSEYSISWSSFVQVLTSDERCAFLAGDPDAEATLQDLILCVDHYKLGHVICHRLSDFVGSDSLFTALQKYLEKPSIRTEIQPPATMKFPLLIWIDDCPENNYDMIEYARELGITVITLCSTHEAKQWFVKNPKVLEVERLNQVGIISDNVQTDRDSPALNLNAGEDIIRWVRGRRSRVPVLVYCGDLNYARYVSNYKFVTRATDQPSVCQQFIENLAPQDVWNS